MNPDEFRASLARLGFIQRQAADVLGCRFETVSRYALGKLPVPRPIVNLLAQLEKVKRLESEAGQFW